MSLKAYLSFIFLPVTLLNLDWAFPGSDRQVYMHDSAVLHVLIFAQDDPSIGVEPDIKTLKRICDSIDTSMPDRDLILKFKVFDATLMTQGKIEQELRTANIGSNDIVWCYYSGHGSNYDGWPKTAATGLPLSQVNNILIKTGARLTITTYDCCNWREAEVPVELDYLCIPGYDALFIHSKGNIRMCSSQSEKFSFGMKNGGGIFTNALADNIQCYDTWLNVLQKTRDATTASAKAFNKQQAPVFAFSQNFQDGTYKNR